MGVVAGGVVSVLVGAALIGSSVIASAGTLPESVGGADAVATAASVGMLTGSGNAAVVASASASDAVAGARLARLLQGPLLFTSPDRLSASAAAVLRSTSRRAFVVGGTDAVGPAVVSELAERAGGGTRITRLAGADRWATLAQVEARAFSTRDDLGVVVVIGNDSDGAAAVQLDRPLAMVTAAGVPEATAQYLRSGRFSELIIVGGTHRVPESVEAQLARQTGLVPRRIAGTDRYQTALAVLDEIHPTRLVGHATYVASGVLPHDGLIAAAAGAVPDVSGPVLLSPSGCDADFVPRTLERLQPTRLILVSTPPWAIAAGECSPP